MSLGTEFQTLAVDEITDGELWTHSATFTYGPRRTVAAKYAKATDGTAIDPQTLKVAAFPVMKALEEGGRKIAMWEIYVPASTITVAPTVEDKVTLDSVALPIVGVNPLGANAVNAVYVVLAVR